ncbi:MAG: N-acetylmuramoyl-L-alanine amidase [Alphaproteobacteria bacterium]|nr:N-acetylmuramoyl-L-alanine amidase [Alphaproteobacteria bacterium]
MIKNTIKFLLIVIFAMLCGFQAEAKDQISLDAVKSVSLIEEDGLYNLTIEFHKKAAFTPRVHILPNGIQMFLSFNKPVNLPKISKQNSGILKGYFFEKFGNSSLMFIMALKHKVKFIKKKYTKDLIKISFRKKPVIIIDAGHGGKDPGTQSPYEKYLEKNIALITAIELRSALLKTGHYDVVLTRDRDEFISLDDRIKHAKSVNGDILISLHTDYNKDKNLRGISVYTLPSHGFNESDKKFNDILRKSKRFSKSLMGYIPNLCKIKHQACRSSDLKILRTNIPSVLVELGCISNSKDSKLLISKLFRKKVIYAILYALDEFFNKEKEASRRQVVR